MEERKAYSKRITTLLLYSFHQYLRHNHQTKRYLNINAPRQFINNQNRVA